jgi:hypothetical protein
MVHQRAETVLRKHTDICNAGVDHAGKYEINRPVFSAYRIAELERISDSSLSLWFFQPVRMMPITFFIHIHPL